MNDETLAALGEGRLLPSEEAQAVSRLTADETAAMLDLFPARSHLLGLCPPECGHPRVERERPENYVRVHAGLDETAAIMSAHTWERRGAAICVVPSHRFGRWHIYKKVTAGHAKGDPDLNGHFHQAEELDLSRFFRRGEMKAQIPDDIDIKDRDLRANGRAVWTVSRDAEGRRWAELDTSMRPAVGKLEWAR